jgi:hypothetical protein
MTAFFSLLLSAFILFGAEKDQGEKWGQIGHYVTGEIAEQHLSDEAKEKVQLLLGDTSLPLSSVWMDDIRSDDRYDYTNTWHWVTIPDGQTYDPSIQEESGDIIWALETLIGELKAGELSEDDERKNLMMVIHMIGDIHQPMHVGTGEDRGGNDVRVQWMGESTNLHSVWDTKIIQSLELSYSELAKEINKASPEIVEEWQNSSVRDWAYESMEYRDEVYDLPDNRRIGYEYRYFYRDIIFKRLHQAGVRIAGVLNEIYGE